MIVQVRIPEVGESVREALLVQWYRKDGDRVSKDEILFVIETDKVTLEVVAEATGLLRILIREGETVPVGTVVGTIETQGAAESGEMAARQEVREEEPGLRRGPSVDAIPPRQETSRSPAQSPLPSSQLGERSAPETLISPSARRLADENRVDVASISGTGPQGRITRGDILLHMESSPDFVPTSKGPAGAIPPAGVLLPKTRATGESAEGSPGPRDVPARGKAAEDAPGTPPDERVTRTPMSPIRRRIAERLLQARQTTAMLTTFNEIDMSRVQALRARFKEPFHRKYGVSLGIMSFFIKAAVAALQEFTRVNSFLDGTDIVTPHFHHIGIAVGADRGLVVPVIRHADRLSFSQLELAIADFVQRTRENRLDLSDLEGGTFTISNGGIYGSLLSTPILNFPQSGILGMHKIEDRPVVVDAQIVVRPMMYVALSYDHRIIDGREAVTFLLRIKESIEDPERIMMEI